MRADASHPTRLAFELSCSCPLSHSLSVIAAISLVRALYWLCLGKTRRVARSQDGDRTVRLPKPLLL